MADAIQTLATERDRIERLEAGGYRVYQQEFDVTSIGEILEDQLFS
ncbi:hypothetical protein DM2_1497 [Halorubrum sp. DM2]|nr:hypothetical protein DM2_1497 [Halorubrum sp. DM2]